MRLYDITEQILEYSELLANKEITQEEFNKAIEQLDAQDKYKSCYYALKEQEDDIVALDNEIERLNKLKQKRQKKIEGYKNYLIYNLEQVGGKVKTDLFEMKVTTKKKGVWKEELPEICYKEKVNKVRITQNEVEQLIADGKVDKDVFVKVDNKTLTIK
jgi:hypothetical protein